MAAANPDPLNQLDERTARLKEQLAAKSSLFDVLSPPPPQKVTEDAKLQSAIRSISFGTGLILVVVAVFLVFEFIDRSSSSNTFHLIFLGLLVWLGQSVVIALRLLRSRVARLEAELHESRRTSQPASADAPSDATKVA